MKYCRQGWKDVILTLVSAEAGLCSLKNDAGQVVVTDLPLIEDPDSVSDLPKSYATPVAARAGGNPHPVADEEKVAAVLAKAKAPGGEVVLADIDRANVPTLRAILDGLEAAAPADAKSKDLKEAILDVANALVDPADETDPNDLNDAPDPIGDAGDAEE